MRRGTAPRAEFVPWKPDVCEEPGCDERHPAYSRNGMAGPWRCREHDQRAAMPLAVTRAAELNGTSTTGEQQ